MSQKLELWLTPQILDYYNLDFARWPFIEGMTAAGGPASCVEGVVRMWTLTLCCERIVWVLVICIRVDSVVVQFRGKFGNHQHTVGM